MSVSVLGIDIAKQKFDVALLVDGKTKHKTCKNSAEGFETLTLWLEKQGVRKVHACLEATGNYGEDLAIYLHEAGHIVSIVNPARIKGFAQSELLRTKTDKMDAALIARFCLAMKPGAWIPSSPEIRSLRALVRRVDSLIDMRSQEKNPASVALKLGIVMSRSEISFSRRDFLCKTIALVPTFSIAAYLPFSVLMTSPAHAYSPSYFTWEEWAFLQAACERLIPTDKNGPGAVELGVLEFIDREMEGAFGHAANWYMQGPFASALPELGYQSSLTPREVYRAGIAAVDAHCRRMLGNKPFSDLPVTQQDFVLTDLENGVLDFENVSGRSFFGFLLQNTKEGYLADPIHGGNKDMGSWKMIGFPGARADFADWVDKYGARYPLGPVGIAGGKG